MSNLTVRHRSRRLALLVTGLLLASGLAACSGGGSDSAKTPDEVFAQAQQRLAETAALQLSLSTDDLPKGVEGLVSADGYATDAPAFDGTVKLVYSGFTPEVPVRAVDGKVFAQLPFTSSWSEIDPSDYGAPDPALLVNGDQGFGGLLDLATDPQKGDSVRGGTGNKEVLTSYTAEVPGDAVKKVMPSADSDGDFAAEFQFTDSGEIRVMSLTGVFYAGKPSLTYTVEFSDYSKDAREITAP
jgi:lipoprotein LprG